MNSGSVLAGTGIHHHDIGKADDGRDRRDVVDEIEIELVIERRIARVRCSDKEESISVRRCPHDRLGSDVAASARAVLDDELLAEPFRQQVPDESRSDVGRAGWSERHDQAHRPRRVSLCRCGVR
jgi:hypothetical protein